MGAPKGPRDKFGRSLTRVRSHYGHFLRDEMLDRPETLRNPRVQHVMTEAERRRQDQQVELLERALAQPRKRDPMSDYEATLATVARLQKEFT